MKHNRLAHLSIICMSKQVSEVMGSAMHIVMNVLSYNVCGTYSIGYQLEGCICCQTYYDLQYMRAPLFHIQQVMDCAIQCIHAHSIQDFMAGSMIKWYTCINFGPFVLYILLLSKIPVT